MVRDCRSDGLRKITSMSLHTMRRRRFLFADVSFADLWRAARYRGRNGDRGLPSVLDLAHAARFAAQSQAIAAIATPSVQQRRADICAAA